MYTRTYMHGGGEKKEEFNDEGVKNKWKFIDPSGAMFTFFIHSLLRHKENVFSEGTRKISEWDIWHRRGVEEILTLFFRTLLSQLVFEIRIFCVSALLFANVQRMLQFFICTKLQ
jgi:hypothetical protein